MMRRGLHSRCLRRQVIDYLKPTFTARWTSSPSAGLNRPRNAFRARFLPEMHFGNYEDGKRGFQAMYSFFSVLRETFLSSPLRPTLTHAGFFSPRRLRIAGQFGVPVRVISLSSVISRCTSSARPVFR